MLLIQNYDFKITEIKDFIYLMQSNKVVICSNRQIFIANLADLNAGPTKLNLKRGEFL